VRIGIVINNVESVYGMMSGGHRHAIFVAREWTMHELTFFACYDAVAPLRAAFPYARIVRMPSIEPRRRARIPALLSRMLLAPLRLRELRTCDVVLASSHYLADVIPACLARRGRGAVTIWHAVDAPLVRGGGRVVSTLMWASERCALVLARARLGGIVAGTRGTLDALRLPGRGQRATVTCNGVDHALAEAARAARPETLGYAAIFVGRLHPTKRVHDAIDAWVRVAARRPEARLALVGPADAGYLAELRARVARQGIAAHVDFLGEVDERAKFAALANARVFLFPSVEEGWGIVLAEAGAAGLPCVTYDLPVFREVFPAGRLAVPVDDVAALADAVLGLLADENAHGRLATAGRLQAARATWARAAEIELGLLAALGTAPSGGGILVGMTRGRR